MVSVVASAYDVHQHFWPEAVLEVLERRVTAPRAVWTVRGHWEIRLEAEPAFAVHPVDHDPGARVELLARQGVDRALVALSAPVGAESLLPAVSAWNEAGEALPGELGWWAAVPHPPAAGRAELAREALRAGAVGVLLPASELARPGLGHDLPDLFEAVEHEGAPVFVHPGVASRSSPLDPGWWAPATDYVAQQAAAWHTFQAFVRPEHPSLRAIFALLAGLAPLHAERTASRGGPTPEATVKDELVFYDTSSLGPRAVAAIAGAVGFGQLVHGSDHPVAGATADPVVAAFGSGSADPVRRDNAGRALSYTPIAA